MVNLWNDFAFIHTQMKHLIQRAEKGKSEFSHCGHFNACACNVGDIHYFEQKIINS